MMAQSPQYEASLVFTPLDNQVTLVTPSTQDGALQAPLYLPNDNNRETKPLNVVALISGGKDSFYTILHCLKNGHKIVALANLYPPSQSSTTSHTEQEDLNSHMYQTVGYKVIPHYAKALGIPLYRRPITGNQVQKATTYSPPDAEDSEETESLMPLLKAVKRKHPEVDAVCSGAILSDYQRTRVESVAIRLNLIPLAYLWKYPVLPPSDDPNSLLRDMAATGLDARIIRIASADLAETFLTRRLTDPLTIAAMDRIVSRYPTESNGAGLGEGGEYETLVVDGPDFLFREKVQVEWPEEKDYVKEGWGNVWVDVHNVQTVLKDHSGVPPQLMMRTPELLDRKFLELLKLLHRMEDVGDSAGGIDTEVSFPVARSMWEFSNPMKTMCQIVAKEVHTDVRNEIIDILSQTKNEFEKRKLKKSAIMFTVILLRSMDSFQAVNKVYGEFFDEPNPPARATFAVGDIFPDHANIIIQFTFENRSKALQTLLESKKGLHVQSRSYWAPANIARYSQATAISLSAASPDVKAVYVAGQIPLNPATMAHPSTSSRRDAYGSQTSLGLSSWREKYDIHAVLSLQHLWRIGREMDVSWWTGAVAYLSPDDGNPSLKAILAGKAWGNLHDVVTEADSADEDEERDAYDEMQRGRMSYGAAGVSPEVKCLPDWSIIEVDNSVNTDEDIGTEPQRSLSANVPTHPNHYTPPFFAAEVQELPMKSDIEWHAFLGLTGGPIKVYTKTRQTIGTIHEWSVDTNQVYITLMLPWTDNAHTNMPETAIQALVKLSSVKDSDSVWQTIVEAEGFHGAYASYVDFKDQGFKKAKNFGGVVPCRSLHDKNGKRLAAVLMFRCDYEAVGRA